VTVRLVLHVLPVDLARGAQTYARELRLALDDATTTRHRTLTLFRSPPGALRPDLTLDVSSGPLRRAIDPRAVLRLRRVVRRERPDVVVAHGGEPLKYAALAGVPKERLAYYKIGIGGDRLHGVRGALHRRTLRRVGTIAAVSNDAADEVRDWGVATMDVVVIPNGRDPALFASRDATREGGVARLVFVGHLTASKRPDRFIEVVRRLREEGLDLEVSMAGDGPLLDALRAPAERAGVTLLGRVDDVPGLLARSDMMVMTSVPEGEGMPGVLIEGGLAGLAVVTTRVPGAADVVADGESGFVVPVEDLAGLVDACSALVRDPDLRARFGAVARARCEREFSLDASIGKWRELLSSIDARSCTSSI
jgi:glycosyltransferase involved in cell wall biosynthesis